MHYTLHEITVDITCTFGELCTMDSLEQVIYATPSATAAGVAVQLYIGARPNYLHDFVIATVQDFCEEEGWDSLGWEEMTEEEREHPAIESITITVPRTPGRKEWTDGTEQYDR